MSLTFDINLDKVVRDAVEKREEVRSHWRDAALRELMLSYAQYGGFKPTKEKGTSEELEAEVQRLLNAKNEWQLVESLLEEADRAVEYPLPQEARLQQKRNAWALPPITKLDAHKKTDEGPSVEALESCARRYLFTNWALSPTFELWLVRMMIYSETYSFTYRADYPPSRLWFLWQWVKRIFFWLVAAGSSANIGDRYGVGVGLLAFGLWTMVIWVVYTLHFRGFQDFLKKTLRMRATYEIACGECCPPMELERAISIAENEGVIWPEYTRALIARAAERDSYLWRERFW